MFESTNAREDKSGDRHRQGGSVRLRRERARTTLTVTAVTQQSAGQHSDTKKVAKVTHKESEE